ncbi:GroES-like protein [Cerioporus squamosus]|nr:GroES-like protein [Cerioporus squamosus]
MSLPKQQKVLYLLSKGGALQVQTADVPSPGPDDVLLRVEASGLNHIDGVMQDRGLFITTFPTILGWDAAGVVAAVGSNVDRLKVGDRVLAQGHFPVSFRALQQYLATAADFVAKIPDTLSFDDAATMPVSVATAAISLRNAQIWARQLSSLVELPPLDKQVLVLRSPRAQTVNSSSLSRIAIQFLKLSGFSPIITTASLRNTQFVKSLGATHVVDRTLPRAELVQTIQNIAGGPIELVYDAICVAETKELGYEITLPGGALVVVVPEHVDQYKMPSTKDVRVVEAMGELTVPPNREFGVRFTVEFEKLLQDGVIKPGIPEVIEGGLNGVQEGLNRIKTNKVSGQKLVVHPQETL